MELRLPNTIGGKRDLILAMREIEQILSDEIQNDVRSKYGAEQHKQSHAGRHMVDELLKENNLNHEIATLRQVLKSMEDFKNHSPQIRLAFSQEPDPDMYRKVVEWFRREIHPGVLVQIGVQPSIGGGFTMQTPVRRYDFSFKTKILNSTDKFLEVMKRVEA